MSLGIENRAIGIQIHVRAVYIFGERAAAGCDQSCRGNRRPYADGSRDEAIRRGVGQDGAQISLIGVVDDLALWPRQRLPIHRGIEEARAGDAPWAAGAQWQFKKDNDCCSQGQPEEERVICKCHAGFHGHFSQHAYSSSLARRTAKARSLSETRDLPPRTGFVRKVDRCCAVSKTRPRESIAKR